MIYVRGQFVLLLQLLVQRLVGQLHELLQPPAV